MSNTKNNRRLSDEEYKGLIKEENEKLRMSVKGENKKDKENFPDKCPERDYRAVLKKRSTITKRDWGGHCFEYCGKEIAHSTEITDLTQEQAKIICEILRIPLAGESLDRVPKEKLCPCGCGEMLEKGRKFRQGHDARLKWRLIKEYRKTKSKKVFEELSHWGWERFIG